MPKSVGGEEQVADKTITAINVLSGKKDYYRFNGSLTTPPCSEGVRWLVCKKPVEVSGEQVTAFHDLMHHDNNRPVQAVNARPVLK